MCQVPLQHFCRNNWHSTTENTKLDSLAEETEGLRLKKAYITMLSTLLIWAWPVSNIKIHIGHTLLFLENEYLVRGSKCFHKIF
jgi:hypothetical protein